MIVALAGSLTEGCSQTLPSICTPGGIFGPGAPVSTVSSAALIFFSHSQGLAGAGKNLAKRASEAGRAKNSEAFTVSWITKKPLETSGFRKIAGPAGPAPGCGGCHDTRTDGATGLHAGASLPS